MKGFTIWFTGLSGSGKSTLSNLLANELQMRGYKVEVLDGDEVRTNLSQGLGFSKADRDNNIQRIAYVCKLLSRNGVVAIAAAISPYKEAREKARKEIENFIEVHADCTLDECINRDVKGLYKKAIAGEISNFTGVSDPYEPPDNPEVLIQTHAEDVTDSLNKIMAYLESKKLINTSSLELSSS